MLKNMNALGISILKFLYRKGIFKTLQTVISLIKPNIYLYFCSYFKAKFEPKANMKVAHHMLLFSCEEPFKKNQAWYNNY